MKRVEVSISIKNSDGKVFTQNVAGGLPVESKETRYFILDGSTDEEIIYKMFINVGAVYYKSQEKPKTFLESLQKLKDYTKGFLAHFNFKKKNETTNRITPAD